MRTEFDIRYLLSMTYIFNLLDAFLTVYFVTYHSFIELNPIMNFFLSLGNHVFLIVKILLPLFAIIFLWQYKEIKKVQQTAWIVFILYLLLILYWFALLITWGY